MGWDWAFVLHYAPLILVGAQATLVIFAISLVIGTALGLVLALMRLSPIKLLQRPAAAFVWFFRGMPALVILFFVYYGLPIIGLSLGPMEAACIGLGLDTAAYKAEVIRSGLISVDRGQAEAAEALGMPKPHYYRRIIIPQAVRIMIPPYFSNSMALLRSTSLASVITVEEMTGLANRFISSTFRPVEILAIVGILYLLMSSVLQVAQHYLERRYALPS